MRKNNEVINYLQKMKFDFLYVDEMRKFMEIEDKSIAQIYQRLSKLDEENVEIDGIDKQFKNILDEVVRSEKILLKALEKRQNALRKIDAMEQPYRNVLYLRYICNKRFDEIASQMGYSTKRIYQLHELAVENFAQRFTLD